MDATRRRRTRDRARQAWYAACRQRRFARFLGFLGAGSASPAVSHDLTGDGPLRCLGPSCPLSEEVGRLSVGQWGVTW